MTLSIGDRVVKLHPQTGEPIMDSKQESYVEYEIVDYSPTFNEMCPALQQKKEDGSYDHDRNVVLFAKLRKVR